MLDLPDVKSYLRVDTDADDALISMEMNAADHYLAGAVTNYDANYRSDESFAEAADVVKLAVIAQLYEDRTGEKNGDFIYTIRTLINQLNLWGDADA